MTSQDTERYVKLIEVQREHQLLWIARYPGYCKSCNGWGRVTWEENQAPLGSGLTWNEQFEDFCGKCLNEGICPRCGTYDATWDPMSKFLCPHCEWNEDKPDGLPQVAEEIVLEEPLDE